MKLLLAEDDPILPVAMQRLLRQWGYGLELAGTGATGQAPLCLAQQPRPSSLHSLGVTIL